MQQWSEILGHQRVREILARAIDTGRLHHGYLFTGPRGVGKFTVARALAAALNCLKRPDDRFAPPCGSCSPCKRILAHQHPDVFTIEPTGATAKYIRIEQIRTLQKASISAPYEARYRVVLIDDAHFMTEEAANALLKTLEEPPARMLLILITDQPHRLLDTIISRCQRVRFGALPTAQIANALPALLQQEKEEDAEAPTDPTLFTVAAEYSEGSLGQALSLLKSGILQERRTLISELLAMDSRSSIQWLDRAQQVSESSQKLEENLDILTVFFRDIMLFHKSGPRRLVNKDLADLVEAGATRFSTEATLAILEALISARQRLRQNINAQLLTEELLNRVLHPQTQGLLPPL